MPATADDDTGERVHTAALAMAIAASAALLVALWIVDYLPTHDGPQHVFLGHLENHFDDAGAGFDRYLVSGAPVTGLGFHLLFAPLEKLLPWRTALRAALSVIALTWGWGHFSLVTALHPRRAPLALVGFATAIGWTMYMGFFAYTFSMGLALMTLGVALRGEPWTAKRRCAIAGLVAINGVVHLFGAELTCLALLVAIGARCAREPARIRQELSWLPLFFAPAGLIALFTRSPAMGDTLWLGALEHVTVLPRMLAPGPYGRSLVPIALAIAGLGVGAQRARARLASNGEITVLVTAGLVFAIALVAPLHLASWEFFAPRFLPFAVLGGVALLPLELLPPARARAASLALGALTLASLGWTIHASIALRQRVDEALAGLSAPLRRSGPRLAVALDSWAGLRKTPDDDVGLHEIPYYAPLFNLGALYAVEQGGIPPYVFTTSPRLHPFVFSTAGRERYPPLFVPTELAEPRLVTDPAFRRGFVTFLATLGADFEDVVLYGRPDDGDVLASRGYVADFRAGGLFMGHLAPCPVEIDVEISTGTGGPPRSAPVLVEYGFDPVQQPSTRVVIPAGKGPPGGVRVRPRVALCGPAWVRATLDLDGSGGPSRGDRFCAGADREAKLRVEARAGLVVTCVIAAAP